MNDLKLASPRSAVGALAPKVLTTAAVLCATLALASTAQARCGDDPTDLDAVAAVRAQLETRCPCATANSRMSYMRCSRNVIDAAVADGTLPRLCKSSVRRCLSRSTCGRPGYVTCCRTNSRGTTRCSVKRDPARCRAPRGGSACVSDFTSCCDACGPDGCLFRPTPTPAPTPTVPPFCQSQIGLPSLGTVPFATRQGSPDCVSEPPAPPIVGSVEDESGNVIKELGAGCLYTGNLPASTIPDGGVAKLSATGVNGLTVTLGPSAGSGPFDCTNGAGPDTVCINGDPGLDGMGACITDVDCGNRVGACGLRPNCYFGPPVPVPGIAPSCVVNSFLAPLCGSADLTTSEVTMATALTAAIYLTGDPENPCPQCIDGVCTGGMNEGLACTPVGSAQTSVDCPPQPREYAAKLTVIFPDLTTGSVELADESGFFCLGQEDPGAFHLADARRIALTGSGLGSGGLGAPFQTTLVGVFCVPRTNLGLIDMVGGFPAAGAFSSVGEIDLSGVLGLPLP